MKARTEPTKKGKYTTNKETSNKETRRTNGTRELDFVCVCESGIYSVGGHADRTPLQKIVRQSGGFFAKITQGEFGLIICMYATRIRRYSRPGMVSIIELRLSHYSVRKTKLVFVCVCFISIKGATMNATCVGRVCVSCVKWLMR